MVISVTQEKQTQIGIRFEFYFKRQTKILKLTLKIEDHAAKLTLRDNLYLALPFTMVTGTSPIDQ